MVTVVVLLMWSAGSHAEPVQDAAAWLSAAYQRKASGDLGGAVEAFREARAAGATASRGPDAGLARQARDQLAMLPGAWWGDVYAETFDWHRAQGAAGSTDLVPTVGSAACGDSRVARARRLRVRAGDARYVITRGRRGAADPYVRGRSRQPQRFYPARRGYRAQRRWTSFSDPMPPRLAKAGFAPRRSRR